MLANSAAALPPIPIPLLNAERDVTTSPPASPTIALCEPPAHPSARAVGETPSSSRPSAHMLNCLRHSVPGD